MAVAKGLILMVVAKGLILMCVAKGLILIIIIIVCANSEGVVTSD